MSSPSSSSIISFIILSGILFMLLLDRDSSDSGIGCSIFRPKTLIGKRDTCHSRYLRLLGRSVSGGFLVDVSRECQEDVIGRWG